MRCKGLNRRGKIREFIKRVVTEELVGVRWKFTRYIGYKTSEEPTEPSVLCVLTAAGTEPVVVGEYWVRSPQGPPRP